MPLKERFKIFEEEYNIPMEDDFREGLQRPVDVGFKPTGPEVESEGVCVTLVRELWKIQNLKL
jgi:hypothetical protein